MGKFQKLYQKSLLCFFCFVFLLPLSLFFFFYLSIYASGLAASGMLLRPSDSISPIFSLFLLLAFGVVWITMANSPRLAGERERGRGGCVCLWKWHRESVSVLRGVHRKRVTDCVKKKKNKRTNVGPTEHALSSAVNLRRTASHSTPAFHKNTRRT